MSADAIKWGTCTKCAKRVCMDAAFCGRCGGRVERAAPTVRAAHTRCPDCAVDGTVLEDEHTGAFVCARCGLSLGVIISETAEWRAFDDDAVNPSRVGFPIEVGMPQELQLSTTTANGMHSFDAHRRVSYLDAHRLITDICVRIGQPLLVQHSREVFGVYRECTDRIKSLETACAAAVYTASFARGTAYTIPLRRFLTQGLKRKKGRILCLSAAMCNLTEGVADNTHASDLVVSLAAKRLPNGRLQFEHLMPKSRDERVLAFLEAMCRTLHTNAGLDHMRAIYGIYGRKFPHATTPVELVAGGVYYLVLRDMVEHPGEYGCLAPRSVRQVDVANFVCASTSAISEMLRSLPDLRLRREKRAPDAALETRPGKRRNTTDE